MYFDFFKNVNYLFNGVSHQVKNIFNRPVISTKQVTSIRIDNENSPDKSALDLYGDSNAFYINALINNITQKELWPQSQLEFSNALSTDYGGYAFHILEEPSTELERGDIIILNGDLGQCEAGDVDCYPSYGIIHEWDPRLRKIWVKYFVLGTNTTTTESLFFKENNRFKIYKRNSNDVIDNLDGVSVSNERAFQDDPNYTFDSNLFTMKRISSYVNSANEFVYSSNGNVINPLQTNFSVHYSSDTVVFDSFVGEYNSGNTNGTCSLLDAYILEANGQTGTDKGNYIVDYRFRPTNVLNYLTLENENERYIYAANRKAVPTIVDDIERQLNG